MAEREGASCGNASPGALENAGSSASATAAKTGGRSRRSTSAKLIDGWKADDTNPFRHRVCRSIQLGDLQLVLTVGDRGDGGPQAFAVPPRTLAWLLTGEVPKEIG